MRRVTVEIAQIAAIEHVTIPHEHNFEGSKASQLLTRRHDAQYPLAAVRFVGLEIATKVLTRRWPAGEYCARRGAAVLCERGAVGSFLLDHEMSPIVE
jgi:hypothetical protein